ncbi:MAG: proprotein convertase P-domain-containing protein [Myxococcales bacterium]|nr:proprotein convertase P-domain-containing protein [Myxococcales bacterium]
MLRFSSPLAALLVLAPAIAPAVAQADQLDATRAQPIQETGHAVSFRVDDGVARFVVRRRVKNSGKQHEEATWRLSLPVGAAATGLRIKAGQIWHTGELMERDKAAALYQELTGFGPHAPKDPALLFWRWASELQLQVFPIAPDKESTVEYTLTAPTEYRNGRYFAAYPRVPAGPLLAVPGLSFVQAKQPTIDGRKVDGHKPSPLLLDESKPAWFGDREPNRHATYQSSAIESRELGEVRKVTLDIQIRHTYRGDLGVQLIDPKGRWYQVFDSQGGGENDVRMSPTIELQDATPLAGTWRLVIDDHARMDTGTLERWSLSADVEDRKVSAQAKDTPLFLPDAPEGDHAGQATLSLEAPPIDTLLARLGRVPASPSKSFSRLEIDAAPQLRPLPEKLSVVFVVDASRSLDDGEVERQISLARSFLRHVPDASFDVVAYRRRATRLLQKFSAAPSFDQQLAAARAAGKLERENGSALDEGIRVAAEALQQRQGNRMIVVTSDALLRPSFENASAIAALGKAPSGTTLHLVLPEDGGGLPRDRRDDDHALAPIAEKGGGVLLHISGISEDRAKDLDGVTLGLVRPVRIDGFHLVAVPDLEVPDVLAEGDGLRTMKMLQGEAPAHVELRGKIWARPFRQVVQSTLPFSRATAAFVFSLDMHHDLDEAEQFRVAMAGRAVSPVTSYLAIEPGVRPSRAGLVEHGAGTGSGQGFGSGHGRLGSATRHAPRPNLNQLLAADLKRCVASHGAAPVTFSVHTTFDEIVDVERATPIDATTRCVMEAAWALELTWHKQRDRFEVSL